MCCHENVALHGPRFQLPERIVCHFGIVPLKLDA
jgi:hypothetical protein